MHRLADAHDVSNAQVMREMNQMKQELQDMKDTLGRLKATPSLGPRRSILFGGRQRPVPVQSAPEKPKPAISIEDLLPLLPHLSGAIPQLKNPKVADSIKVLSNPAVMSMIQQFIASGGLNMLKGQGPVQEVSRRERRGLSRFLR
ncbi:hypothetical protein AV540_17540 [Brevibacillus parabrevis]|jgi:hypothetical protein|uniref:Uncharacterized protein n=2 Tax=Brevibacillus TaxID=55080 RepID=A0A4Y3PW82_BREPA|nr:hypothetical protein [Brevibacillus parabrevis]MDH6352622.1 hypothetical protein [Brevibacillus sp. 1238]NRQ56841.1 hypothetical protein [Brevibacillus sp. HD1.4A]HBZ83119.1 hypothetical protein [Brevibacillus sp.]KZE48401.1 hypothetical protein AV540_17540 [Brevibacillus parabrevis]MBU8715685.1 hypothetical protein [Brevibacillus parabrevis]